MEQTIKAYKLLWKQTLKAYKSNMGTNHTKYMKKDFKYININQSIIAKKIHEFLKTLENYK